MLNDLIYMEITGGLSFKLNNSLSIPDTMVYYLNNTRKNTRNNMIDHDGMKWKLISRTDNFFRDYFYDYKNKSLTNDIDIIDNWIVYKFSLYIQYCFYNHLSFIKIDSPNFLDDNYYNDDERSFLHQVFIPFVIFISELCNIILVFRKPREPIVENTTHASIDKLTNTIAPLVNRINNELDSNNDNIATKTNDVIETITMNMPNRVTEISNNETIVNRIDLIHEYKHANNIILKSQYFEDNIAYNKLTYIKTDALDILDNHIIIYKYNIENNNNKFLLNFKLIKDDRVTFLNTDDFRGIWCNLDSFEKIIVYY